MAQGKTIVIKKVKFNNASTETTINKTVDFVVVDNVLVADFREANPGVIIRDLGK